MYTRCAYFEGTVDPDNQEYFDSFIDREVVPIMRTFPGLRQLRILRPVWREEGAPNYYQQFELTFDSLEAIEHFLESDERKANVAKIAEVLPLFKGTVKHMNHRVDHEY